MRRMHLFVVFLLMVFEATSAAQPTVRTLSGSIHLESPTTASATVVVENGTMYDVYLVGATSEVAGAIEFREKARGAATPVTVKEVPVPAFGRLEMSAESVHLALLDLKRPIKLGETIPLTLATDNGVTLTVAAVVK